MNRRPLNLLTVLSLLLFVAVCALWVRGASGATDVVRYTAGGRHVEVASEDGMLSLMGGRAPAGARPAEGLEYRRNRVNNYALWRLLQSQEGGEDYELFPAGFAWLRGFDESTVFVPHWSVALALAVLPLRRGARALAGRRRRRLRSRRGQCPSCGYDLTGNVSGACPECGTAASAEALP